MQEGIAVMNPDWECDQFELVPGPEWPKAVPGQVRPANPVISVVIPAFNEEGCAGELVRRLKLVFDRMSGIRFEALIVDNGSSDKTLEILIDAITGDSRFTVLQMSKPFGADNGISAGLSIAKGHAVVIMVADLQDPPEMIPTFIHLWE
jgi:dolichol-phosphate mannosyltransferase